MDGIPDRALGPGGVMVRRAGRHLVITAPGGRELGRVDAGDAGDEMAARRAGRALAAECARHGFSAADLVPVTAAHQGAGWRDGDAPRFGADPADTAGD